MEAIIALWVLLSLLVGYIGKVREGKFFPAFISSLVLSPIIAGFLTLLMPRKIPKGQTTVPELKQEPITINEPTIPDTSKVKKPSMPGYMKLGIVIFILLALTLPFHYVPEELKMFPKERLTLNHTFIFQSDIDRLVKKYNDGNLFEKASMLNDPLYKKLMEEGLIKVVK